MPVYESKGTLTGTIAPEDVAVAQKYLTSDDMTQYLDPPLNGRIEFLEWQLDGNGHDYRVIAFANRELDKHELKQLADEVSGQNSDGLGEGFEQQDFCWVDDDDDDDEEDCIACDGSGMINDEDGIDEIDCPQCDGSGYREREGGHMISFDWKTNDSTFTRIA